MMKAVGVFGVCCAIGVLAVAIACGPAIPPAAPGAEVTLSDICGNTKCNTQGSLVVTANPNSAPQFVGDFHEWLGARIPRKTPGVPDNCGNNVTDDQVDRGVDGGLAIASYTVKATITQTDKTDVGAKISAAIKGQLSAAIAGDAAVSAGIDSAVNNSVSGTYDFIVSTYALNPSGFHARLKLCNGQSEAAQLVDSITVAEMSGTSKGDLSHSLKANLGAVAGLTAKVVATAEAGVQLSIDKAVDTVLDVNLPKVRFALAYGFFPNQT